MSKPHRILAVLSAHVCAATIAGVAWADDMPADYLVGTWALGTVEACAEPAGEQLSFKADGTFASFLDGMPSATGFWQLEGHELELHMVSSPASFDDPSTSEDDLLAELDGRYEYYHAKGLTFDVEPDAFRMVATMGDVMRGADLYRCP